MEVTYQGETRIAPAASRDAKAKEVPNQEPEKEKAYIVTGPVYNTLAKDRSRRRVLRSDQQGDSNDANLFIMELAPAAA